MICLKFLQSNKGGGNKFLAKKFIYKYKFNIELLEQF